MNWAVAYLLGLRSGSVEIAFLHELVDRINEAIRSGVAPVPLDPQLVANLCTQRVQTEPSPPNATRVGRALVDLLRNPEQSIPGLVSSLDEPSTRYFASILLGWFGPAARSAILPLLYEVADGSGAAGAAREAILRVGDTEQDLLTLMRKSVAAGDDFQFLQLSDLASIAGYNSSPEYTAILRAASESVNAELRANAARAISWLRPPQRQAQLPVLLRLREDPEEIVRQAAAAALNQDEAG